MKERKMIIKEFFNKIYLSIYLKLMGTEEELKQINKKFDDKHKHSSHPTFDIDELDRLSTGTYVDDQGKAHTFVMPMPERFWKYFKYKSKNYDDDIFRKKNLLFIGQISPDEKDKVIKQIAKSEVYRNKPKKSGSLVRKENK